MMKFNNFATWFYVIVSDAISDNLPLPCPECDGDGFIVNECNCCDAETEEDCSLCDGDGKVTPSKIAKERKWHNVFTERRYQQDLYDTVELLARAQGKTMQDVLENSNIDWEWANSPTPDKPCIQVNGVKP